MQLYQTFPHYLTLHVMGKQDTEKQVTYSAPFAAQELARASLVENRPALQTALEKGLRAGGWVGSSIGMLRANPALGGGLELLRRAPKMTENIRSAVKGYKALKETGMGPEELAKARETLISLNAREGGLALGSALASGLLSSPASLASGGIPLLQAPRLARYLTRPAAAKAMEKGPQFTEEEIENLRNVIGTSVDVHRGRHGMWSDGAGYTEPGGGLLFSDLRDRIYARKLFGGNLTQARKMRAEGGVVLPGRTRPMPKVAFKQQEKPQPDSRAKRIAKKVGIGLGATAIAGGLSYAALGPRGRQLAKDFVKHPRQSYQAFGRAWASKRGPSQSGSGAWTRTNQPDVEGLRGAETMGLGRLKTKAEFRKKWHEAARKHHPDMGGSTEKMQEVNRTFEAFKKSRAYEKLAHLLARLDGAEREKLSSVHWPTLARVLVK